MDKRTVGYKPRKLSMEKGTHAMLSLLDAAKKSLADGYRRLSDGPVAMESFFYGRARLGIPSTPEACNEAIARVTAEEIQRAAASLQTDVVYFLEGTLGEGDFEDDED